MADQSATGAALGSAAASFNKRRVLVWQLGVGGTLSASVSALGLGSAASVAAGALFLAASFLLQDLAFSMAFGRQRRPTVVIGLLLVKLALVLGITTVGLRALHLDPLRFAIGATTLLLAILIEAWYANRSSR